MKKLRNKRKLENKRQTNKKQKKKIRNKLISVTLFIAVAIIMIIVIPNLIIRTQNNKYSKNVSKINSSYTAIVLGAKVLASGRPSQMLADRLDKGIELYKAKKVKKLLLTGDHGRKNYNEVDAMKKYAISKGVNEGDIFTDHAGFTTYDSLYRARNIFAVKKAVIVTQKFHIIRALYIAEALGLKAEGLTSDNHRYGVKGVFSSIRECLANIKAFWQVLIKAKPKFLGPKIPITGGGRASRG